MRLKYPTETLLLVGRDDWRKDAELISILLSKLGHLDIRIVWDEPGGRMLELIRRAEILIPLCPRLKWLTLKVLQIAYGIFHPSYFAYLCRLRRSVIDTRCKGLMRTIRRLSNPSRVTVLSRSAGGRIASMIADEAGIGHVICLGYPFKHPDRSDEPERYEHLATLRTPMLILQGSQDAYGGEGLEQRYPLSDRIRLRFFDTTHNFELDDRQAEEVVAEIENVLRRVGESRCCMVKAKRVPGSAPAH